ncbi:MAG: Rieske 2Fe-2S domain-containing protein [Leptodesmis sp.]|uniref:aromatic ring-hydroxylating dioxygenase subunit alpha n=1 Tax=Leptodesmis sp. TaxID=3100501 RepID=UPI003D0C68E4
MVDAEFNFFQQWYPLSPVEDLDPEQPTSVTLLNQRLVIWKPPAAPEYCVFLDYCPHRLAPLSEGRIDPQTGQLMCSYHGWQFDAQGTCRWIPQAASPDVVTKNEAVFCVKRLPTQQVNGLLWVWADANTPEMANSKPLPLSPQIDRSQGFVWSSMVRELAYDWQTLVENVADPAHVPFAHHGVQGDRERAKPVLITIEHSTATRIEAETEGSFPARITFEPPCRLEYAIQFGGGRQVGLVTYCIPVAPGKSRIVAQFPQNFATGFQRLIPRWWEHIKIRNAVLDGDMVLLHLQEHYLQDSSSNSTWKAAYKLPTSADRLVIEFRHWFDRYCQGHIPWPGSPAQATVPLSREALLDRYQQHTLICHSCRRALAIIHRLQWGLLGYFAIAVAIAALLPDPLRLRLGLPLAISALLGLGLYTWLKLWLEPQFYFVDYVHARK